MIRFLMPRIKQSFPVRDKEGQRGMLIRTQSHLNGNARKVATRKSPLYRHLDSSEINILSEHLLSMLQEEIENGSEFTFLNDSLEYRELIEELKHNQEMKK